MSGLELQGVVFDVDGVLFDTEHLAHQIWVEVSREMGWPQVGADYLEFVGRNRTGAQEKIEREGVPMEPGVREILDFLRARRIPAALATSTGRERTQRRMELTGLGPYFTAIVTGDQVERGKPDPEIYLRACRALGTEPAHTLAVEDSRNGILSASRAGMQVIMVPDMIPPTPELEALLLCRRGSLLEVKDLLEQVLGKE